MNLANDHGPPILTRRGTRPGSAFADITFGLLLRRILEFRHTMRPPASAPPRPSLQWTGERAFTPFESSSQATEQAPLVCLGDIVWADDLAACVLCPQAQDVVASVGAEASYLSDAFAQHGLRLSYGPSKTAAICVVRGHGSREVRRKVFGHCAKGDMCTIPVLRENTSPDRLPLVRTYRHLGILQAADGSLKDEMRQRIGQAWSAFREARRKLFKCRRVEVTRKGTLLRSFVLSKLLVGAGTWPPLLIGEARMFQACVFGLYRQILCVPHDGDQQWHFCSVCARTGLCSPDTLLHAERLRYALQAVKNAPDALWACIQQDAAYCGLIQDSFTWLFERVGATCKLGHPATAWNEWKHLLCARPGLFRGWVKRACALQMCVVRAMAAHVELHQQWARLAGSDQGSVEHPDVETCSEACLICRRAFSSLHSWASHAARLHGYRSHSTKLAQGQTCLACGKVFATPGRLKRHLDHASDCCRHWGAFQPTPDADDDNSHPQAPPVVSGGERVADHPEGPDLLHCRALEEELQAMTAGNAFDVLNVVSKHCAPLKVLRCTVTRWYEGLSDSHSLKEPAEDVKLTLYPEYVTDSVQPFRKSGTCGTMSLPC